MHSPQAVLTKDQHHPSLCVSPAPHSPRNSIPWIPEAFNNLETTAGHANPMLSYDLRSSSAQSCAPSFASNDGRRILLLVYVHGFLGDDCSFQSFPAHVHNMLKALLADTHTVRTKIYPRYKSRRAIGYARDEFSAWLKPQESPETDIVLLGHSMGGLLAAEVILLPAAPPLDYPFRHRIVGSLNFDTPFLEMHPGMIKSGIASLFRPSPDRPIFPQYPSSERLASTNSLNNSLSQASSSTPALLGQELAPTSDMDGTPCSSCSSVYSIPTKDPNYNPPFQNDIRRPIRKGIEKFVYFANKHSSALVSATKEYFMSHLEFGGCIGDFRGLERRYARIRALEDVRDSTHNTTAAKISDPRVRFLNLYTASTSIIKERKLPRKPLLHSNNYPLAPPSDYVYRIPQITISGHALSSSPASQPNFTPVDRSKKPIRDKIFCVQPTTADGKPDPCWPRVFMEGVDEIGAHCGLFFPGKHYEGLLTMVVEYLECWIKQTS